MDQVPERHSRLSLTKRQLQKETGTELLNLLTEIVADGILTDEEILRLQAWLHANQGSDIPAVDYLANGIDEMLAAGTMTEADRVELFVGIEKVLPVTERGFAREAREHAAETTRKQFEGVGPGLSRADLKQMVHESRQKEHECEEESGNTFQTNADWRVDPMTEPQRRFIRSLGGTIHANATKGEASVLIDGLLRGKPLSPGQHMVLRFWGRVVGHGEGTREVSEWMDSFYAEDGDRKRAWELFKEESEDNGLQGDPMRVPFGAGAQYLARIKAGGPAATPKLRPDSVGISRPNSALSSRSPEFRVAVILGCLAVVIFTLIGINIYNDAENMRRIAAARQAEDKPATTAPTTVTTNEPPPVVAPSEPARDLFKEAVGSLQIGGIIGGSRSRVFINGTSYQMGERVDGLDNITVQRIDEAGRKIVFIDASGRQLERGLP